MYVAIFCLALEWPAAAMQSCYLLPAYASAYVCILIFFLLTVRCVNCGQVAMAVGRVEAASRNLEIIISLFLKRNLKNYKENLKI